jgi:hypothetical protein
VVSRLFLSKLQWPALCVALMLQRSPVVRLIGEVEFSLLPRVQHMWAVVVSAVTVGAYNSVTAASGDVQFREDFNNTSVFEGEELLLVIEVEGSELLTPETWVVDGELPVGVQSNINFGLGIVTISGTPTETGSFPITIQAWQRRNMRGDKGTDLIFTIVVEAAGPILSQQPVSQQVDWGNTTELSVTVEDPEGVTYQWQKQDADNPELFEDLPGETNFVTSFPRVTTADEGVYQVIVTDGSSTVVSQTAELIVMATGFQSWRDTNFEDPFSTEAGEEQNNDFDSFINLFEFLFGRDPNVADSGSVLEISLEMIDGILCAVFQFPAVPEGVESTIMPQATNDLIGNVWTLMEDGVNGVIIESTVAGYFVKFPADSHSFCRLQITSAP